MAAVVSVDRALRSGRLAGAAKSVRHAAHQALMDSARARTVYLNRRPVLRDLYPGPGTTVVIDGYPRSANTYSVAAFRSSNPGANISSHLHSWRALSRGVELNLPTLLLIREPEAAVSSLLVFWPGLSPALALRHYVRMYEHLVPYKQGLIVGEFAEVTKNYAKTIRALNSRFSTEFIEYEASATAEDRVRRDIEEMERIRTGGEFSEDKVARPSASRSARNAAAACAVRAQPKLLAAADRIYRRWVED